MADPQAMAAQIAQLQLQVAALQNQQPAAAGAGAAAQQQAPPPPVSVHGLVVRNPEFQPFDESLDLERIPPEQGRKQCIVRPVQSAGNKVMIMMAMRSNFARAVQCCTSVNRSTFYQEVVEVKEVTVAAKRTKWEHFLSNHYAELSAEKTVVQEIAFLYKVTDFIIDTFATDKSPSDAAHLFETARQKKEESLSEFVERMAEYARVGGKLLFGSEVLGAHRQAELARNVNVLIKGMANEALRTKMRYWCGDFIVGVPSVEIFNNRLQGFVIAEQEAMISLEEKERSKLVGLRYNPEDTCLTERVDFLEVDGSVAAFIPTSGAAIRGKPTLQNITQMMLCRRCGFEPHPPRQCGLKVGQATAHGRIAEETPAEYCKIMNDFFSQQRQGGRGHFIPNRGGRGGVGGYRGGRGGGFAAHRGGVHAVEEDAVHQEDDGLYADVQEVGDAADDEAASENC